MGDSVSGIEIPEKIKLGWRLLDPLLIKNYNIAAAFGPLLGSYKETNE